MPKISPWHSTKQPVHHTNKSCNVGKSIEKKDIKQGTGGKPECDECRKLNSYGM